MERGEADSIGLNAVGRILGVVGVFGVGGGLLPVPSPPFDSFAGSVSCEDAADRSVCVDRSSSGICWKSVPE